MDGLLIFDQQSDVIYTKFNKKMKYKLYELAVEQGLVKLNAVRANVYFVIKILIFFVMFPVGERIP